MRILSSTVGHHKQAVTLVFTLFVASHSLNAQRARDIESWNELDVSMPLNSRTALTIPLVARDSFSLANPQLYGLGPFFDVVLTPHFTVTAGYLFVDLPQTGPGLSVHVPLAAVTFRQSIGRLQVSDRNRAEGLIGIAGSPIRYRNKLVLNLSLKGGRWFPFISDEVFYDFSQSDWSQNRLQAGLGRNLNQHLRLDVFYLERNVRNSGLQTTHAVGTTLEVKIKRATRRESMPHEEN